MCAAIQPVEVMPRAGDVLFFDIMTCHRCALGLRWRGLPHFGRAAVTIKAASATTSLPHPPPVLPAVPHSIHPLCPPTLFAPQ